MGLIGIFVNAATDAASGDRAAVIQAQLAEKDSWTGKIRQLFLSVSKDGQGSISRAEFEHLLSKDEMIGYFNFLGIAIDEAQGPFELLDTDESGDINIQEFVVNCFRLKGEASALD